MSLKKIPHLKVFISYSSEDEAIVKSFANVLKKNQIDVWCDKWSILAGQNFISSIQSGISESDFLILMLSKNALKSGWVDKEWKNKYHSEVESGNVKVIVIRIEDCNVPGFLAEKKYINLWGDSKENIVSRLVTDMKIIKEQSILDEIKDFVKMGINDSGDSIYNYPRENINKRLRDLNDKISLKKPDIEVCYSIISSEISAINKKIEYNDNELSELLEQLEANEDMSEFDQWQILWLSGCKNDIRNEKLYIKGLNEKISVGLPNLKSIDQITSFLDFIIEDS